MPYVSSRCPPACSRLSATVHFDELTRGPARIALPLQPVDTVILDYRAAPWMSKPFEMPDLEELLLQRCLREREY